MSIALKSIPTYYHYWGKAQPQTHKLQTDFQKGSLPAPYHLLVYHCLDVAAVAYHLLNDDAAIMNDLSAYLMIENCSPCIRGLTGERWQDYDGSMLFPVYTGINRLATGCVCMLLAVPRVYGD